MMHVSSPAIPYDTGPPATSYGAAARTTPGMRSSTIRQAALAVAPLVSAFPALGAQSPSSIPIHDLGASIGRASLTFRSVNQVVPTSGGRVFVVDNARRITYLLDGSLANPAVVLDSAPGKPNTFSSGSILVPFFGDSVLFYDRAGGAFVVLTP